MIDNIESTYAHFLTLTGEPNAAALLTHAAFTTGQPQATSPDAPLTVAQAATALGVSQRTIYDLTTSGKLRHSRIGRGRGTIRITRDALAEYQHASEPTTPTPRDLKHLAHVAGKR